MQLGAYQAVERISNRQLTSCWMVRATGESTVPQEGIAEIFQPPSFWDAGAAEEEIRRLLERAADWQRAAKQGTHWSPIHELGRVEVNGAPAAFIVLDAQAIGLDRVASRGDITASQLHRIVTSVAGGLRELGRPHGQLCAASVVASHRNLSSAAFLLRDPADSHSAEAHGGEAADLRDLGRLTHELVTGRSIGSATQLDLVDASNDVGIAPADDLTAKRSARDRWTALNWPALRLVCEDLLQSNPDRAISQLDELDLRLISLRHPLPWKKLAAAVLALALLIGGIFGFLYEPPHAFNAKDWAELCTDSRWFGDLYRAAHPGGTLKDSSLAPLVDVLKDVKPSNFDPGQITGDHSSPAILALRPPDAARTRHVSRLTEDSVKTLREIKWLLSPKVWPPLGRVENAAAYMKRQGQGWKKLAAFLESSVVKVTKVVQAEGDETANVQKAEDNDTARPGSPDDLATSLQEILDIDSQLKSKEFVAVTADIDKSSALSRPMADRTKLVVVDMHEMEQDRAVWAGAATDRELFDKWIATAPGYVKLADNENPLNSAVLSNENIAALREKIASIAGADPETAMKMTSQLNQASEMERTPAALPQIQKNLVQIQTLITPVTNSLNKLHADQNDWDVQFAVRVKTLLAPDPKVIDKDNNVDQLVKYTWKKRRADLTGRFKEDELRESPGKFKWLQHNVDELRERLMSVNALFALPSDDKTSVLSEKFYSLQLELRSKGLKNILDDKNLPWIDGLPDTISENYTSNRSLYTGNYDKAVSKMRELMDTYAIYNKKLDDAWLPHEKVNTEATFDDDVNKFTGEVRKFVDVHALDSLLERINRLKQIHGSVDRAKLVSDIARSTVTLAEARAIWKRLGEIDQPWPVGRNAIIQEQKSGDVFRVKIASSMMSSERREQLTKELSAVQRRRVEVYFDNARDPDEIVAGLEFARANSILDQVTSASRPWLRFDILRYELENDLIYVKLKKSPTKPTTVDEEELRRRIDLFSSNLKKLSNDSSSIDSRFKNNAFADLSKLMDKPQAMALPSVGPSDGWTRLEESQGVVAFQNTKRSHTLCFVLIEPRDVQLPPFYLCTSLVSVKLARDILPAISDKSQLPSKVFLGADGRPLVSGPVGWMLVDGKLTSAAEWFGRPPNWPAADLTYPDKAKLKGVSLIGINPLLDMPLQYVSPSVALQICNSLHCRVPTTAEWQQAYELKKDNMIGNPQIRSPVRAVICEYLNTRVPPPFSDGDGSIYKPESWGTAPAWSVDKFKANSAENVWFRDVNEGAKTIQDLIGNVAVYVCDEPEPKPEKMRVIGASALSSSEWQIETSLPTAGPNSGYSDVGVRLVFTSPYQPLTGRLARWLEDAKYMTAPAIPDRPQPR